MLVNKALVNEPQEMIEILLHLADRLRQQGERDAACCCIEAVLTLLRAASPGDAPCFADTELVEHFATSR